jgi:hypothetical protein
MNGASTSCNIFAQQERAFLFGSQTLKSPMTMDDEEVTGDISYAPSDKLSSTAYPTTALPIKGNSAALAVRSDC